MCLQPFIGRHIDCFWVGGALATRIRSVVVDSETSQANRRLRERQVEDISKNLCERGTRTFKNLVRQPEC